MMLKNDRYTYRITWSPDDDEYVGLCVEFPSLSWLSKDPESALKGIRRLVCDVVKEMGLIGDKPPHPLSIKKYSGKFLVRVTSDIHRSLTLQAAEEGVSLNRLINSKLCE